MLEASIAAAFLDPNAFPAHSVSAALVQSYSQWRAWSALILAIVTSPRSS